MNPFVYLRLKLLSTARKGGDLLWVAVVVALCGGFIGHLLWWVLRLGWRLFGYGLNLLPPGWA